MTVLKTLDYNIFKKHPKNRPVCEKLVKKYMASIEYRNLLDLRPIDVDEAYRILDGQHRLEAAKRLKTYIYYQIKTELCGEDMILLNNNQKIWNIQDYHHFWLKSAKEEYIKLEAFMKKNNLNINLAFLLLGNKGGKSPFITRFKNGQFEFPLDENTDSMLEKLDYARQAIEIIKEKTIGNKVYLESSRFIGALVEFFGWNNVNPKLFVEKKVMQKINLIRPCFRKGDYLIIFKDMYNFRNEHPVFEKPYHSSI